MVFVSHLHDLLFCMENVLVMKSRSPECCWILPEKCCFMSAQEQSIDPYTEEYYPYNATSVCIWF